MKSFIAMSALALAICLPGQALAGGAAQGEAQQMIWLEPFSYMQMRQMRQKMRELPARSNRSNAAVKTGRPSGRPASGRPPGGYSARIIHLRDGAYPPAAQPMHEGMPPISHARPAGAAGTSMWLEKPDHEIIAIDPSKRRKRTTGNYRTAYGGNYRIVAYRDAGVSGGVRSHLYSFYEFMAHGDKPPFKRTSAQERAGYFAGRPEFEIRRIYPNDSERYRSRTGNKARLIISYRGKPLAGKPVSLTTGQGWHQTRTTDANGQAEFTLIKEDFPEGGGDKRRSSLYLAQASHQAAQKGQLGDQSFEQALHVATMSIRVSPSALDWESRSMAYFLSVFTIGGAGFAIAIRRRRKRRKNGGNGK